MAFPKPGDNDKFLAASVLLMGWNWAAFVAHSTLGDVLDGQIEDFSPANQVAHGLPVPQMDAHDLLHWHFIDDYCVVYRVARASAQDPGPDTAAQTRLPWTGLTKLMQNGASQSRLIRLFASSVTSKFGVKRSVVAWAEWRPHCVNGFIRGLS